MQTLRFIASPSATASESASSATEPAPATQALPTAATAEPSALQSTLAEALARLARLLPFAIARAVPVALPALLGQVMVPPVLVATAALVHLRFPFQNKTNYTNQFK